MKPYSFFASGVTTVRFCAVVAGLFLVAFSLASGQTLATSVGPVVFVDSLGSFSLYVPEGFAISYDRNISSTTSGHAGWINSLVDQDCRVGYQVSTHEQFFRVRPELRPTIVPGADTVKEMLSARLRVSLSLPTSGSNADVKLDSMTEERTDSGLRVFVVRLTRFVRNSPNEAGETTTLGPWRYVTIPIAGDCVFVKFHGFVDPPPPSVVRLQRGLVQSVRTWRK